MNEILIYGPVGPDFWEPDNAITANSIREQLIDMDGDVTVRISSGGGDVYEGIDIMTELKNYPGQVTVIVESLAASAASFIAVGGADEVLVRPSSELMIHKAWTFIEGNADDARKTLADLERQDTKLATIYADKAGGSVDDWLERMSAETWYSAEEAVAAGLADKIIGTDDTSRDKAGVSASLSCRRFKFANRAAAPPPPITRSESGETITKPSTGKKGDTVSVLNQLAQEMGVKPEKVQEALSGFFNEEEKTSTAMEVPYPGSSTVVPTGTVDIAPVNDVPQGVGFELTDTPEGWTGAVDKTTGVLTVEAPENAQPGAEVSFTVTANSDGGSVVVEVPLTVKAAGDNAPEADQAASSEEVSQDAERVSLDAETYAELKAAAQHGWQAMEAEKERCLVAEVDRWVAEGRISQGLRDKAISAMKRDPEAGRDIYGSNPAGSIPRNEVGYGKDIDPNLVDKNKKWVR